MNVYERAMQNSSGGTLDGTAAQIRASAHSMCVNRSRTNSPVIMCASPSSCRYPVARPARRAATETITHRGASATSAAPAGRVRYHQQL